MSDQDTNSNGLGNPVEIHSGQNDDMTWNLEFHNPAFERMRLTFRRMREDGRRQEVREIAELEEFRREAQIGDQRTNTGR